jgi:cadmium resistance protein CadD (predicted permease)
MGLVPISIGVFRLIKLLRNHDDEGEKKILEQTKNTSSKWNHLSILTVAGVTFSNGADNIGIYTPLFAKYNSILEVTFIIIIFMAMTGVWCSTAYYLVSHPAIANRIQKMGNLLFPFVLIGIGIFILTESFIL